MTKLIRAFALALGLCAVLAGCASLMEGEDRYLQPIPAKLVSEMRARGMSPSDPILIRIFKRESELEVWKRDRTGRFALLKTYPMCRWSGRLGPKTAQGDRQAPEGFYSVTPSQMNPRSLYYLSFDLGYPNQLERALGYEGAALMVHGACSSAGCYAMTDEGVAEIYAVAREAFRGGQAAFQVQALPFRMTPENMVRHRNDRNYAFWETLKQGYDIFDAARRQPKVAACGRRYVFDSVPKNEGDMLDPLLPCPELETIADPLVAQRQADDAERASMAAVSGMSYAPQTYVDGGMHPIFRAALERYGARRLADDTSTKSVKISRPEAALADPYVPEPEIATGSIGHR